MYFGRGGLLRWLLTYDCVEPMGPMNTANAAASTTQEIVAIKKCGLDYK